MSASAEPSPQDRIRGDTRNLGVIGWPVSRSLSPAIHNAAFAELGMPWTYVGLPVPPDALADAMAGLRALGFAGANVTMPHKTEAAERCDVLSEDARRLQAVNTLTVEDNGTLVGDNTDAPGFERFLRLDAQVDPAGMTVLLFGGGGAARAVALALGRTGASRITVAVREPANASGIEALLDGSDTQVDAIAFDQAAGLARDVVVNATPVGASGSGTLPMPGLGPSVVVVDLLYPDVTPLQDAAERSGARAFGGLGLLLQQAGLSFERWTGVDAPMAVMARAARSALAEGR